jgi:DNA-binding transcriptional regulator YiaG
MEPTAIPEILRTLRVRLGDVSQEQLAHRIGVSWSTVSRWENARGKPSPLAREKLAKVLRATGMADRVGELTEGS